MSMDTGISRLSQGRLARLSSARRGTPVCVCVLQPGGVSCGGRVGGVIVALKRP